MSPVMGTKRKWTTDHETTRPRNHKTRINLDPSGILAAGKVAQIVFNPRNASERSGNLRGVRCAATLARGNCPYRMSSNNPQIEVVHNANQQRFEVKIDGEVALVSYTRYGARVVFDHTYVPEAFRGKGVAAALVRAALNEAREQHWKIVPQCSYVAAFIERHPEFASLVAGT